MIDSIFFTGSASPTYKPDEKAARKAMNEWREANPNVKIISIESDISDHGPSMVEIGGRRFNGLRLWFEQPREVGGEGGPNEPRG